MVYIPEQLRNQVEERAGGICEYCQTQGRITVAKHIDRIIPVKKGGLTELSNLCLSCYVCNNSKKTFTSGIDPDTGSDVELYNPRNQNWYEHFLYGMMIKLT